MSTIPNFNNAATFSSTFMTIPVFTYPPNSAMTCIFIYVSTATE